MLRRYFAHINSRSLQRRWNWAPQPTNMDGENTNRMTHRILKDKNYPKPKFNLACSETITPPIHVSHIVHNPIQGAVDEARKNETSINISSAQFDVQGAYSN